jgi:RecB family exonuclease
VITPRRTRLIRVEDLHQYRRVIASLCGGRDARGAAEGARSRPDGIAAQLALFDDRPARIVVVPTRSAATTLARTLVSQGRDRAALPALLTRDELYDALHARLPDPPRRLTAFERDAMAQAAAHDAARLAGDLPFQIRPGLVAEIVRFYDQLRRQSQIVKRFEELITDALGGGELDDRGAARLLRQTRFLAETFRGYEVRAGASDALDEHRLRELLLSVADAESVSHVIVTVPDWIADPAGLFVADFDLLSRLPNLAAIDIVSTESVLASGFHERLHNWWPGIEEASAQDVLGDTVRTRPMLVCPTPTSADLPPLWFTHRDREEELIAISRRLMTAPLMNADRVAVVFKRPLPYLYLAGDTLGAAGLPFVVADALPLAAEPVVAAVDLVLDAVESDFARESLIALLRSPHLDFAGRVARDAVNVLDRELSEARYLGGHERLVALAASRNNRGDDRAAAPIEVAIAIAVELAELRSRRPASAQLRSVVTFIERHLASLDPSHPMFDRERRARAAMLQILTALADAHAAHHDPAWTIDDLAAATRRWIGDETFLPETEESGVRLLDDQAARYGEFDDLTIVGLVENEWPERPRRNIFYPPTLLKALAWPSEKDRHAAAEARFVDLLSSATVTTELSAFMLEDEAIVSRSVLLDEVPRARLSTVAREPLVEPFMPDEQLAQAARDSIDAGGAWLGLRVNRTPADAPAFHGQVGPRPPRVWSVSALETYIGCPFKFFAQHVLRLEEEPDDEEVMDPRRQGQFVHDVFETFFREWQSAGHREITAANLPVARALFAGVVDRALERLPEGEAALERTRLLGSSAAAGLGEAVFRMEAERPVAVVERLLEERLDGEITIQTDGGPRTIGIKGKADRLDLLADGTFRLIDYKLGWPPDRGKALQLPIYALSAEQRLDARNRRWTLGEAMYLAFKGPKRVVPLFGNDASRAEVLARAQQRVADAIDAIERGEFPPTPEDVFRCDSCSFGAVCRKDYVGEI